jgi:hypothetical protein
MGCVLLMGAGAASACTYPDEHEIESHSSIGDVRGNPCCKSDGVRDTDLVSDNHCEDEIHEYWSTEWTRTFQSLGHSALCNETISEPCDICFVPRGQDFTCEDLLIQATKKYHKLVHKSGQFVAYEHTWFENGQWQPCNCGDHGCITL